MDHLSGFARTDVDELGEVELVSAAMVAESEVKRVQDDGVGDQRARGRRAGDQCADASGRVAEKVGVAARVALMYGSSSSRI